MAGKSQLGGKIREPIKLFHKEWRSDCQTARVKKVTLVLISHCSKTTKIYDSCLSLPKFLWLCGNTTLAESLCSEVFEYCRSFCQLFFFFDSMCCTDTKENEIFLIQYKEIQMGSGAKSYIYDEGLPNIWGNAQIFHRIMKRLLVIYDFAPDPSGFPYIWGKFYFNYQCVFLNQSMNIQQNSAVFWGKKMNQNTAV